MQLAVTARAIGEDVVIFEGERNASDLFPEAGKEYLNIFFTPDLYRVTDQVPDHRDSLVDGSVDIHRLIFPFGPFFIQAFAAP